MRAVVTAKTEADFLAATRALDRVLLWNFFYIPGMSRVQSARVYWDKFGQPPNQPPLQDRPVVDTWWWDDAKAARVAAGLAGER